MIPQLITSVDGGYGTAATENLSWNFTIPNLGKNGLIVFGWVAKEEGGETNPEELNQATFNGNVMTLVPANISETGAGLAYLTGASIPAAGTYTCNLNFKDSPKYNEKRRGIAAAFSNVKIQAAEATQIATGDGGPRSLSLTPLTANALVVATWGWRVGFAETWGWGTPIRTNRGDNATGITMAYSIIVTPAAQTISCDATNPEHNGLAAASFAMQAAMKGQIL